MHPALSKKEKFIHACLAAQLHGVLTRYFQQQVELVLLHIDETKLRAAVKYERSTGDELFPHVYGRINKDAIVQRERLLKEKDEWLTRP